jgi:opacity protein-like surface antigen
MKRILAAALLLALCAAPLNAQQTSTPAAPATDPADKGQLLLTIFFKHDQSKNLDEINEQLKRQKFYEKFPPKDVQVVSWYVMMGIGQVVTLRFPAERLREVNRAVEQSAWGGYHTEFYPTYDYKAVAVEQQKKMTGQ